MYYVQESDKPNKIMKFFNCIQLKNNAIILPIKDEEISDKQAERLAVKTTKIMSALNCKKIVVSKNLKKQEQYLNYLYASELEIVDGKRLFQLLSYKVLEYILEKNSMNKENINISFMINQPTDIMLFLFKNIVKEFRRVNIVTNHIHLFKNLEEKMMEEYGIIITITNNKRKSLMKSQIILNFDFPNELINKYSIFDEAIIINLQGNVKIKRKRFIGKSINDYEIKAKNWNNFDVECVDKFFYKDLYEANLYKRQPIEELIGKINKDGVYIELLK